MLYKNHSKEGRVWPRIRRLLDGSTLELGPGEEVDSEELEFSHPHDEGFDDPHLKPADWAPSEGGKIAEGGLIPDAMDVRLGDGGHETLIPVDAVLGKNGDATTDEHDTDEDDEEPQA